MILLEELDTTFGKITITESRQDGIRTYFQDGCFHSQANSEGVSTCAYIHVMHSMVRQSKARSVLLIGCAGGTLATMLHRLGCEVTAVDINPEALRLAIKYFKMPEEVDCIVKDGSAFLSATKQQFDAVAIDAFNSDGTIPEQFTTEAFFELVKNVLKPNGLAIMNVLVRNDSDFLADIIALNLKESGLPVVLFDWPGKSDRNTLVVGGRIGFQIMPKEKPKFVRFELQGIIRRNPRQGLYR